MNTYSIDVENTIVGQLKELEDFETNTEFVNLYNNINNDDLKLLFTKLHTNLIYLFRLMNERLPTGNETHHYWAHESRSLIQCIEVSLNLYNRLAKTELKVKIDDYYFELFQKCRQFLSKNGGSSIPENMDKIEIYYRKPIYFLDDSITVGSKNREATFRLKYFDEGSYAHIYKYKDDFYNRFFIVKKAKKDLNQKELERFKREYETLNALSSPYIIEVFNYNEELNEYVMEFMDWNLDKYIRRKNNTIKSNERKKIVRQILKAFEFVHTKGFYHRDINPNNILLNEYEDGSLVVKISDFGLVKWERSNLTSLKTDFKGGFNDPELKTLGFNNYDLTHEIYALTYTIYFVMTGKLRVENTGNSNLDDLVERGTNTNKVLRPKNIKELKELFLKV